MEYYDGKNIHFFAPLSKQDEFYVPECTNEGAGDADRSQTEVDSFSESEILQETEASLNVTQTSLESNTTLDKNESVSEGELSSFGNEKAEGASLTGNGAASDKEEKNKENDEDEASDDSSSSFEVVKKEKDV